MGANTSTNFTVCQTRWANASIEELQQYSWKGPVLGVPRNNATQISLEGCLHFCGGDNKLYPWAEQASTITTWVLPVIGILLQAPFVSNAFWETVFSLARWIGSPMASLAYIFWNIKVTGKCALIVDMAVPYNSRTLAPETDFGKIRDSFYLLMTMNQYTMRSKVRQKKEAEGLLRIVLFSKDLRLLKLGVDPLGILPLEQGDTVAWNTTAPFGGSSSTSTSPSPGRPEDDLEEVGSLNRLRQEMAEHLRAARKRGVVPVYISTMWFVFSLGLSIESAFGLLGDNAQAHDLALGFLLAWLPVLILSSIVDRNPVAADDVKNGLNTLVDRVRLSLMDAAVRQKFFESIARDADRDDMRRWVEKISRACPTLNDFFVKFAGQARLRYHYGAAHPILTDIERGYIAAEGRDWLHAEEEARRRLVLGDVSGGLDWLDFRELWQVLSAVIIVGGSILGAFVLSYFTPTVGLGCRSGGYTVFGSISLGLLLVEMISWWILDASKPGLERIRRATVQTTQFQTRRDKYTDWLTNHLHFLAPVKTIMECTWRALSQAVPAETATSLSTAWKSSSPQQRLDVLFFKPVECTNSVWLAYIVLAQTIGSYNNCRCKSSTWGGRGGYVDFQSYNTSTHYIAFTWTLATVLSATVMACGMLYIVVEWCLQSHLSTADHRSSAKGLQMTRRFRWLTSPYRGTVHAIIEVGYALRLLCLRALRKLGRGRASFADDARHTRRSLQWTKEITCSRTDHDHHGTGREFMAVPMPSNRPRAGSDVPLIQAQDESGLPMRIDTQAMRLHTNLTPRSSFDAEASDGGGSPMSLGLPVSVAAVQRLGGERQGS